MNGRNEAEKRNSGEPEKQKQKGFEKTDPAAVRIKICGLTRPEEIGYVNEAGVDYCGFVINVPKSRRNLLPGQVRKLRELLSPDILAVGVFRNEPAETIAELTADGTIQAVQLHGDEDEAYLERLRSLGAFPIIRAFHENALQEAKNSSADLILLDHGRGGTGEPFDWQLARQVRRPYFLAGGIGPENVLQALELLHPWGVDMSSLVETDGKKDREKIHRVVRRIREWEKTQRSEIRKGNEAGGK